VRHLVRDFWWGMDVIRLLGVVGSECLGRLDRLIFGERFFTVLFQDLASLYVINFYSIQPFHKLLTFDYFLWFRYLHPFFLSLTRQKVVILFFLDHFLKLFDPA